MLLSEAKVGQVVRIAQADAKEQYNGYDAKGPIVGTVLSDPNSRLSLIGWTIEDDQYRKQQINYITDIVDHEYPALVKGIYLQKRTPCELVLETTPEIKKPMPDKTYLTLQSAKVGDRVRVPLYKGFFTILPDHIETDYLNATVVKNSNGRTMVAWTDAEKARLKNVVLDGNTFDVIKDDILSPKDQKLFGKKFQHFRYLNSEVPCNFLPKVAKPKPTGLLLALIGAGAGLSQLTATSTKQKLCEVIAHS